MKRTRTGEKVEVSETGLAVAFAHFDNRALFLKPGDTLEIFPTPDGKQYIVTLNKFLIARSGGDILLKVESNLRRATARTILKPKRSKIRRKAKETVLSGMFQP